MIKYNTLLKQFRSVLHIKNEPDLIPVTLATVIANRLDTKPVWLMIIAGPSSGKTAVVESLSTSHEAHMIASLSAKSLISGAKLKDTVDGKDASLLARLDGKVMIVKDASTLTSMNKNVRTEVFSQMRNAFDGKHESHNGLGEKSYKAKFGVIMAGTPDLERIRSMDGALGERFISFRPREEDYNSVMDFIHSNPPTKAKYDTLNIAVSEFLNSCGQPDIIHFPDEIRQHAALLVALRAGVSHDPYHRHIDHPADDGQESPIRVAHQLAALYSSLLHITRNKNRSLHIIQRVAVYSIPYTRLRILRCIRAGINNQSDIAKSMKMSVNTVKEVLLDLETLGIISVKLSVKNKVSQLNPRYDKLFNLCVRA